MAAKRGTTTAKRAEVADRRTKAIAMRAEGQSWDAIAEALDYSSRGAACQDVARALEERLKEQGEAADHLREVELEHLDDLRRKAMAVLDREHVLVQNGKIVYDVGPPGGEQLGDVESQTPQRMQDDGPALAAVDRLLRIAERRARLLGLDSPVKVDQTTSVRYVIDGVDMEALR